MSEIGVWTPTFCYKLACDRHAVLITWEVILVLRTLNLPASCQTSTQTHLHAATPFLCNRHAVLITWEIIFDLRTLNLPASCQTPTQTHLHAAAPSALWLVHWPERERMLRLSVTVLNGTTPHSRALLPLALTHVAKGVSSICGDLSYLAPHNLFA